MALCWGGVRGPVTSRTPVAFKSCQIARKHGESCQGHTIRLGGVSAPAALRGSPSPHCFMLAADLPITVACVSTSQRRVPLHMLRCNSCIRWLAYRCRAPVIRANCAPPDAHSCWFLGYTRCPFTHPKPCKPQIPHFRVLGYPHEPCSPSWPRMREPKSLLEPNTP